MRQGRGPHGGPWGPGGWRREQAQQERGQINMLEQRLQQELDLERERLQVQTMCDEIAGSLDVDVQVALENRFRGKHLHLGLIRNGRIAEVGAAVSTPFDA